MATHKLTKTNTHRKNTKAKSLQPKNSRLKLVRLFILSISFIVLGTWLISSTFASGSVKSVLPLVAAAEGSGMIASRQHPGVYWWMRDGGPSTAEKPREAIYAVKFDSSGKPVPLRGTNFFPFNLVNTSTNNNWEDIAIDDQDNIWIGDIGANLCGRNDQKIMKIKEPDPLSNETLNVIASFTFKFPDPASGCNTWNSEAMFWLDGKMYIFAKTNNSPIYRMDLPTGTSGTAKLVRLGTLAGGVSNISVSSLSSDRSRLLVASHGSLKIYTTTNTNLYGDALVKDIISRSPKYTASFTCGSGCTTAVEGGAFKTNSYEAAFVSENKYLYYAIPSDYGDNSPPPFTPFPTTYIEPEWGSAKSCNVKQDDLSASAGGYIRFGCSSN